MERVETAIDKVFKRVGYVLEAAEEVLDAGFSAAKEAYQRVDFKHPEKEVHIELKRDQFEQLGAGKRLRVRTGDEVIYVYLSPDQVKF